MEFRQDINGLRAIAVLLVVLFHFSIPGFQGGFIGVDVFFVISGYLMTVIIFNRLDQNNFSVIDFYLARAKRIIPALLALCLILLSIHWFIMTPTEYIELSKQTAAASLFISNILFWQGAGYFDTSAHEKWLLHTWSLSAEWQFYILYPIGILALLMFIKRQHLCWALLLLALASYLLSLLIPSHWQDAGFFLLPTRAWEMIAGGLVFLFSFSFKPILARALEITGLLFILISGFLLSSDDRWPGWLAIFPVMGSILILYANRQNSIFTNNIISQHIGKISYSLYLWHWPVVVGLNYFDLQANSMFISLGILMSWLCALASYNFIETPMRKQAVNITNLHRLIRYAAAMIFIALLSLSIVYWKGVPARLDPIIVTADLDKFNDNPRWCNLTPSEPLEWRRCIFGDESGKIALIVAGDSHSNSVITAAADAIPKGLGGAIFLGADACPFSNKLYTSYFPHCATYNKGNLEWLEKNYMGVPLLVINRITSVLYGSNETGHRKVVNYLDNISSEDPGFVDAFIQDYSQTLCKIAQTRPVYLMQPIPEMGVNVPDQLIRNYRFHNNTQDISISLDEYESRHKQTKILHKQLVEQCGIRLLDPLPYLCDNTKCYGSGNGRAWYFDDDHLSEFGNKRLIPLIQSIWNQ